MDKDDDVVSPPKVSIAERSVVEEDVMEKEVVTFKDKDFTTKNKQISGISGSFMKYRNVFRTRVHKKGLVCNLFTKNIAKMCLNSKSYKQNALSKKIIRKVMYLYQKFESISSLLTLPDEYEGKNTTSDETDITKMDTLFQKLTSISFLPSLRHRNVISASKNMKVLHLNGHYLVIDEKLKREHKMFVKYSKIALLSLSTEKASRKRIKIFPRGKTKRSIPSKALAVRKKSHFFQKCRSILSMLSITLNIKNKILKIVCDYANGLITGREERELDMFIKYIHRLPSTKNISKNGALAEILKGTKRFIHNDVEKVRRAMEKEWFQKLKSQIPPLLLQSRTSRHDVLDKAVIYIQELEKENQRLIVEKHQLSLGQEQLIEQRRVLIRDLEINAAVYHLTKNHPV